MIARQIFVLPAAFLLAAIPSPAAAEEPIDARLDLSGIAPSACLIRAPQAGNNVNATFAPGGASGGQVRITELIDPVTALPRAGAIELELPVICNGPHRLVLRSANGGLRRAGRDVAGGPFADILPYRVSSNWGGQQGALGGLGNAPLVIDAATARAGSLRISISFDAGGRPLVAGNYEDQIVIELQLAS